MILILLAVGPIIFGSYGYIHSKNQEETQNTNQVAVVSCMEKNNSLQWCQKNPNKYTASSK